MFLYIYGNILRHVKINRFVEIFSRLIHTYVEKWDENFNIVGYRCF